MTVSIRIDIHDVRKAGSISDVPAWNSLVKRVADVVGAWSTLTNE